MLALGLATLVALSFIGSWLMVIGLWLMVGCTVVVQSFNGRSRLPSLLAFLTSALFLPAADADFCLLR